MKSFRECLAESLESITADKFWRRIANSFGIPENEIKQCSTFAKGAERVFVKLSLLNKYDISIEDFIDFCEKFGWYSAKNVKGSDELTLMRKNVKYHKTNNIFFRITDNSLSPNFIKQNGMRTITSDKDDAYWHYKDRIYMFTEDSLLNVMLLMQYQNDFEGFDHLNPTNYDDVITFNIAWRLKDIGIKPSEAKTNKHLWKITLPEFFPIYSDLAINSYEDNGAVYTTQNIPAQYIENLDNIMSKALELYNNNIDAFPQDGD